MRPFRTLLVGIIAFALGFIVANLRPLSATEQLPSPQEPPVTYKSGADGITFQNRTKNPVLVVGLTAQQPTRFIAGTNAAVSPNGSPVFLIYEVSKRFIYRSSPGELGPCVPAVCLPPPPPCGAPPCEPWRPDRVWELNPTSAGVR